METTENGAKDGEHDHAGVLVATCLWCIERRDVCSTRIDGVGGDDSKNSGENERDKGQESKEREKQDGGYEQGEKESRKKEEPTNEEGIKIKRGMVKELP